MKGTKFCTKCGDKKTLSHFKRSSRSRDGRFSHCKECEAKYRKTRSSEHCEYMKQYYKDHKPRWAAYMANYRKLNKKECLERSRTYYWARRMNDLESDMLARCRSRAKKKGTPFNLTIEDIVIPKVCPVLGIEINRGGIGRKGGRPESPSIDRIQPSLGYVKGNVRVISNRANTLKCDATAQELKLVLRDLRRINRLLLCSKQGRADERVKQPSLP